MNKKNIIIISILVVGLVIAGLYGTFATDETLANNAYDITLTGSNGEISVPAGSSKTALYQVTNTNKGVVQYGVAYSGTDITVKVYNDSIDQVTGNIDYGETKFVKLYIENSGTTDSIASIQAVLGYEHGGSLTPAVPSGYTLVTKEYPLSLGDYISYTPEGAKFTPDSTKTNSTSNSEMDPSELNLWRVLSINDDGTVDIISEYVSSTNVYFKGKVGYLNFVGYLNELASKYETEGITVGSRHFGYDGQTEYLADSSIFSQTTVPWTSSTSSNNNENLGRGDTLYRTDYNLVYNVLGTRVAKKVGTTTSTAYWMASRYYKYSSSTSWCFYGRLVNTSGSCSNYDLYRYDSGFRENRNSYALRPIVTLDSGLSYEGEGTSDSPHKIVSGDTPKETIATYISDLYTNATKTTATNNGITYNYASELGMMNDRLGDANVGADDGNIRYYGADPNNYIYFNCSDYSNQTDATCEKWRIIGVFKDVEMADGTTQDLVKLARASTLGNYSWDYTSAGAYDNNWHDATLNTLLNQTYYTSGTTTYYNNSTTGTSVSFATNGIKNDTTRNMIAEVVWNLGGWNTASNEYADELYDYERGTAKCTSCTYETTWPGKIALMYPSDYGYATDFNECTKDPYNYETSGCYDNDWLYQSNTTQWLLTPYSGSVNYAWYVYSDGFVDYGRGVGIAFGVRPVLYLNSELAIETGNGSKDSPYVVR